MDDLMDEESSHSVQDDPIINGDDYISYCVKFYPFS